MQLTINMLFVCLFARAQCVTAAAEDIDRAAVTIRLGHDRIIVYKYASEVWLLLFFFRV
jgi:hypothetical protein